MLPPTLPRTRWCGPLLQQFCYLSPLELAFAAQSGALNNGQQFALGALKVVVDQQIVISRGLSHIGFRFGEARLDGVG